MVCVAAESVLSVGLVAVPVEEIATGEPNGMPSIINCTMPVGTWLFEPGAAETVAVHVTA
jgi:hypothetical protein